MDDRAAVDARFGVRWQAVFSGWAVAFLARLAISPFLLSLYGLLAGLPVERGELRHKRG